MAKSAQTINLENQLAEVKHKISKLSAASADLGNVSTEVSNTYGGEDAADLYGNKYDEMSKEESDKIDSHKNSFSKKKSGMGSAIATELAYLASLEMQLGSELLNSVLADAEAEAKNKKK